MGIHIKLPIYIHAQAERLKSRPVRIVFDWLADVFSVEKSMFQPELNLGLIAQGDVSQYCRHIAMGMSLVHDHE